MKWYKTTAIIVFNTLLLFIFLNAVFFIIFEIKEKYFTENRIIGWYGIETTRRAYPDLNDKELLTLLNETWTRPWAHEPFSVFKERPYTGTYVNVGAAGFRFIANQGPWPIDSNNINIFIFGGSTTFGYGVADNQTIPSYLQEILQKKNPKVHVYNFGRGAHFSAQERILFERMLLDGLIPDIAIFIDGTNDYRVDGLPRTPHGIEELFDGKIGDWKQKVPVMRAALGLKNKISGTIEQLQPKRVSKEPTVDQAQQKKKDAEILVNRYLKNKKMIEDAGNLFGVETIFVWQPVPIYKYNAEYHLFPLKDFQQWAVYTYPLLRTEFDKNTLGPNFLWAADIQEGINEPLYVDASHYNLRLNKLLAEHIATFISKENLQ